MRDQAYHDWFIAERAAEAARLYASLPSTALTWSDLQTESDSLGTFQFQEAIATLIGDASDTAAFAHAVISAFPFLQKLPASTFGTPRLGFFWQIQDATPDTTALNAQYPNLTLRPFRVLFWREATSPAA